MFTVDEIDKHGAYNARVWNAVQHFTINTIIRGIIDETMYR